MGIRDVAPNIPVVDRPPISNHCVAGSGVDADIVGISLRWIKEAEVEYDTPPKECRQLSCYSGRLLVWCNLNVSL